MSEKYDYLYNRILDVSAVIHISTKLFAMFIVMKYTPKDHRYHSYFVLNIMFWNFMCNLIFTFMHITPLYPAQCYRLDGISSILIDNESLGHATFLAVFTTLTHCGVALLVAFPYRYIVFAYPNFTPKPIKVVLSCCALHAIVSILGFPLSFRWFVTYDDYPEKAELPDREFTFCLYPYGFRKFAALSTHLFFVVVFLILISVFSFLFLRKLRNEKHAYHSQTIALQKKLFVSLVIITGVVLIFGGIPFLICVVVAFYPHIPYARYTVMICYVILINHGTIYSVAYLTLFKSYRDAVKLWVFMITDKVETRSVKISYVHSSRVVT